MKPKDDPSAQALRNHLEKHNGIRGLGVKFKGC
jgi:hypothetical protein